MSRETQERSSPDERKEIAGVLLQASREIQYLREENKVLRAQIRVLDLVGQLLGHNPPGMVGAQTMAPDSTYNLRAVAHRLDPELPL